MGVIWGLYGEHIGIMENTMEIMAFRAIIMGLGLHFTYFWGLGSPKSATSSRAPVSRPNLATAAAASATTLLQLSNPLQLR